VQKAGKWESDVKKNQEVRCQGMSKKVTWRNVYDSKNFIISVVASAFVVLAMSFTQLMTSFFDSRTSSIITIIVAIGILFWGLTEFVKLSNEAEEIDAAKVKEVRSWKKQKR
jgi:cytochrome c biogenesis protein CcdA